MWAWIGHKSIHVGGMGEHGADLAHQDHDDIILLHAAKADAAVGHASSRV